MNFDRDSLLLYAVTDRAWLKGQTLAQQVEQALLGGATMVQLREKQLDLPHFRREALEIQALCRRYGVPFLINDNVDLALDIGADGVHVGQEDMEAGLVRQKLGPGKILGVSAHSPEEALRAQAAGADLLVKEGWTVARTEKYVEEVLRNQTKGKKTRPPLLIRDVRFFLNSLDHSLAVMRSAGVAAQCQRKEEGEDLLLTIRIPKAKGQSPSGSGPA